MTRPPDRNTDTTPPRTKTHPTPRPPLLARLKRALYRGDQASPTTLMRAINRLDALLYASNLLSPRRTATLEVTGRHSGRRLSLPVAVTHLSGERYLVSMLGENTNWVRNVRAAHGHAVLRSGGPEPVTLHEIPADERAPVIRRYLAIAPGARPHIPVDPHAPLTEFERLAHRHPVFRVAPREDPPPSPTP
ncbi:nitroreductase/quinone reductase family protein [Nocardiopsis alba]|uniref:nitroreductase/quinone reductase family protein n=1 Tax=Nocardiopsis alba TaxID=53437 RepID=UPI00367028C3